MADRTQEAKTFLEAFQNNIAKELVCKMMKANYASAILKHHPANEKLDERVIHQKCNQLVDTAYQELEEIAHKPDQLFPLLQSLARTNHMKSSIWFNEFDEAYQHYKHHKKLWIRYNQLKPYLRGSSYCDIGCGGGDLVAFLKTNHPSFKEAAGIDVLDWRTETVKDKINFQMLDLSKQGVSSKQQFDTITCIAVLHHVGSGESEIHLFLQNLKTAMNPNARLIVEEDVILPHDEILNSDYYRNQVTILSEKQALFSEFLSLSEEDQRDAIIIIDYLANSLAGGVPEMAFPCGFRTINQWTDLFVKNGFTVKDANIQGFVDGIFNRSSHVIFVLDLIT